MQALNVLIVGQGKYASQILKSKYLKKLYLTSQTKLENVITINFNTFQELAKKCKVLQIDIVIIEDEKWILQGIANVMKQNYVNCIAPTSEWTNFSLSHNYTQKLLKKYFVDVPPKVILPVEFPILIKGDGILKKANSIQEIVSIKQDIYNSSPELLKSVFLEKYLQGEKHKIVSIYDGKHLFTFPHSKINNELLQSYSKKIEQMLLKEGANFIGFINSNLIEYNKTLYNTGFDFNFVMPELSLLNSTYPNDILYICLSAIYQKLDELEIYKS